MPPRSPAKRANAERKQAKRRAREKAKEPASAPAAAPKGRNAIDARVALFDELREETPYVGVTTSDGRFVVATGDVHIGRGMFAKSKRPEFGVLQRAVTVVRGLLGREAVEDRVFVDVGANIGTSTIPALTAHGFASAVAVEPVEENHRLLRANACLNGVDERVTALCLGLSNQPGRLNLVMVEGAGGNGWLAVDEEKIEQARANRAAKAEELGVGIDELPAMELVEVELTTVDRLVQDGVIDRERTGMLWVDAEGHEGHVLEAATTLTERGVPTVLEFHPAGLDARGDRGKIHDVASAFYTHFVDVRRPAVERGRPGLRLTPVDELPSYAERFLEESSEGIFTDLLLLKLTTEQVEAGAKLQKLVTRRQRQAQRSTTPKARRPAS